MGVNKRRITYSVIQFTTMIAVVRGVNIVSGQLLTHPKPYEP
jgi:hypothetical protein